MSIIGVDHVQLAMPPGREARAREFYCDVLAYSSKIPSEPHRAAGADVNRRRR